MAQILVVYGSWDGQTAKVAERIGAGLEDRGHEVAIRSGETLPPDIPLGEFDAFVVAGSVRIGRHQKYLKRFVRDHVATLNRRPALFVSVCGALAGAWAEGPARAAEYVQSFLTATGWKPAISQSVAGAIKYTQYGFLIRWIMRSISRRTGRPTDTSRDWEFTDWEAVNQLTARFGELVEAAAGAPAPAVGVGGR